MHSLQGSEQPIKQDDRKAPGVDVKVWHYADVQLVGTHWAIHM